MGPSPPCSPAECCRLSILPQTNKGPTQRDTSIPDLNSPCYFINALLLFVSCRGVMSLPAAGISSYWLAMAHHES